MIDLLSIVALGFFLGMRHATDPDHVIAVSTIVARHRTISQAAWIGAFWGAGHTLTILAVGGGMIALRWVIPARIGLSMEFSVGVMLILLGIMNLSALLNWVGHNVSAVPEASTGSAWGAAYHSHAHSHGDYIHSHPHSHNPEAHPHAANATPLGWLDRHWGKMGLYQAVRPLVVGIVHGLAGSAAVALLVLTTIRNPNWAMAYLLVFGVGTIAGMMLITGAIALPFAYFGRNSAKLNFGLRVASGLISLGFGLFIAYQIGAVNGLFSQHPRWTPH